MNRRIGRDGAHEDSDLGDLSRDKPGCGCTSATPPSWLTALLAATNLRRRRRATLGLVALCASLTSQLGCGPEPGNESDATTSGSSTGPSMSTGDAPAEVSPRMFGTFHEDSYYAGYTTPVPEEGLLFFAWASLQIHQDGTVLGTSHICEDVEGTLERFTWVHVGDDVLQVVPEKYFDDGTFRFLGRSVTAVALTPGQGCADIEVMIDEPSKGDTLTSMWRWVPGELCTESNGEEDCDFTFVWCDGAAPPACVEGDGT